MKNGAEAVERLRNVHDGHKLSGVLDFDLVICDLLMTPVNGLLTLRWVRTAKDSPNRFLPFMMLSGAADKVNVAAARDLGSTDFLAKPFSATTVYKHHSRRSSTSRVRSSPPTPISVPTGGGGPFRGTRKNVGSFEESDIAVVYSADKVVRPKKNTEVWKFILPNNLRDKVGGLGTREAGELPTELLEQAENELERSALEFTDWARNYVSNLTKLHQKAVESEEAIRHNCIIEINMLAHELRGQGGTFGYPLITTFGKMLYESTLEGCREDDRAVDMIKAHIDSISVVIREKISGDGRQAGPRTAGLAEGGDRETRRRRLRRRSRKSPEASPRCTFSRNQLPNRVPCYATRPNRFGITVAT